MAFVSVPGAVRCIIAYTMFGEPVSNVLGFQDTVEPATPRVELAATTLRTSWADNIMISLVADCVLQSVTAYDMSSSSSPVAISAVPGGVPGTGTGDAEFSFTAMRMKLKTAKRGPSYRGRIFLPGISVSQVSNGLFIPGFGAALEGAFDDVRVDMEFNGFTLGIISLIEDGAERTPNGIITPVTTHEHAASPSGLNRRQL